VPSRARIPEDGPLNLLVLAPQPFYEDRGTPIALMHVVSAMSRLGVQVDLVTFPVGNDVDLPGLRIIRAGWRFGIKRVPIGLSSRKMLFDVSLLATAWRLVRERSYAAIYASEEAIIAAHLLGRRAGLPVIYDMQSSMPEQLTAHRLLRGHVAQALLNRCERWFVRRSGVVACSAGLEKHARSLDPGADVEAWRYPGTPPVGVGEAAAHLRREFAIPDDAMVVYYAGTFETYQGIGQLLEAIPNVLVQESNVVFVLAGADPDEARTLTKKAIPDHALRYLGRLSRSRALACLDLADVVVSARQSGRNLPLKIIDYMAAGKAIVATDTPAHRIALDETRALLVAPDSQAIAAGIVELLRDRDRAALLGNSARLFAETAHGTREFVAQVAGIVERATGRAVPCRQSGPGTGGE
jgi:glycosyltransferase involved in cell wall biosynthesis